MSSSFTKFFQLVGGVGFIFCAFFQVSCQRKPALAPSGDPLSAVEPPPMGGSTYNDELKRELDILTQVLDNSIDQATLARVKSALMNGDEHALKNDKTSDEGHLVKVLLTLPELVHPQKPLTANRKLWLEGKFLFMKRRFVEAATKLTEVLKVEPNFAEARNLRARAIFFLGNPDLAIKELTIMVQQFSPKSSEALDALYLIGAIVYESNDEEKHRLTTGITAWEQYLERAEPSPAMKKEIENSLVELRDRKEGKVHSPKGIDPFTPHDALPDDKKAILVAFAKNQLELALDLAERYLAKTYDSTIATTKARIMFKNGRLEEAADLFKLIVEKDKSYAPGYHYQGMAYMLKGEPENAITSWKKTLELDEAYGNLHGLSQRIGVATKMVEEKKGSQTAS